jgi:C_GCAxxG_C_C family probable redox protein
MIMLEEKKELALAYHTKGHNCAQSVALPFCEQLGVDCETAMRAMEGFGAGMGGRDQTCGALSGAIFVAGLVHSDGNLDAPASKQATYAVCADLCEKFCAACNGTARCATIKEEEYISCPKCIELGVELAYAAIQK